MILYERLVRCNTSLAVNEQRSFTKRNNVVCSYKNDMTQLLRNHSISNHSIRTVVKENRDRDGFTCDNELNRRCSFYRKRTKFSQPSNILLQLMWYCVFIRNYKISTFDLFHLTKRFCSVFVSTFKTGLAWTQFHVEISDDHDISNMQK